MNICKWCYFQLGRHDVLSPLSMPCYTVDRHTYITLCQFEFNDPTAHLTPCAHKPVYLNTTWRHKAALICYVHFSFSYMSHDDLGGRWWDPPGWARIHLPPPPPPRIDPPALIPYVPRSPFLWRWGNYKPNGRLGWNMRKGRHAEGQDCMISMSTTGQRRDSLQGSGPRYGHVNGYSLYMKSSAGWYTHPTQVSLRKPNLNILIYSQKQP